MRKEVCEVYSGGRDGVECLGGRHSPAASFDY